MKFLMLAWRDMKNPKMGGAEIVSDIYLAGLVKKGHEVILFSAVYPGAKETESYNGYTIIRKGEQGTVWFHGLKYAKSNEDSFDKIIDQVNTIPFFTPVLIDKKKRVAFFHQLCRNIWFYESKFPVSPIGYVLEYLYLKLYRNTEMFVVSESTKQDVVKYCGVKPENVLVLDNQIDFKPNTKVSKKEDYFVCVGRLTKSKRVHDCIKALSLIKNKETKLYIIGDGDKKYKDRLNKLVSKLKLEKRVVFTGRVSSKDRNTKMQKAKAILVTSVREGWGLIITEANANGTMAVSYDVEGIRDANKTGLITEKNTPKDLSVLMDLVLKNDKLVGKRSKDSLAFAKAHSDWSKNVGRLDKWLRK